MYEYGCVVLLLISLRLTLTPFVPVNRISLHFGIPGVVFRPDSMRYSVVSGLRIYPANNHPGADPRRYTLHGRNKPGVKIKGADSNLCWYINSDNKIATGNCNNDGDEYLFYRNELGEIRSPKHIGRCLDPTYTGGFTMFVVCHSYIYGNEDLQAAGHQFRFDGSAHTDGMVIKSSDSCLDHSDTTGFIYPLATTGDDSSLCQKFFIGSEGVWDVSSNEGWHDISSGTLPWIASSHRNALGRAISSTHLAADEYKHVVEVKFYDNVMPFYEYKVTFPELRDPDSVLVHFAELELPGKKLFAGNDGGAAERVREVKTHFEYSFACIAGNNLQLIQGVSRQECAQSCIDYGLAPGSNLVQCVGFEYTTVAINGTDYEPADCQLLSSVTGNGCNNFYYQMELFTRSETEPEDDPYVSI